MSAVDDLCEAYAQEQDRSESSFREKASRFAPELKFTAWVRDVDRLEERVRIDAAALAPPPESGQTKEWDDRPFQWQIQLQWDVLSMLGTQPEPEPLPTHRAELVECRFGAYPTAEVVEETAARFDELPEPPTEEYDQELIPRDTTKELTNETP